ncbi:MAG: PAS domain S-box protein, partial [Coleofasciculus sp. S288]|nr:PAS domain S-box protein [Coleofasciculus sp. S288]
AAGNVVRYETDILAPDNSVITIDFSLKPIKDENGQVELLIAEGRDLTERKRVEAALRESEERWQLALRGNNEGIWDWNIKTNEVFYSARWKEMLGYQQHELSSHLDEWKTRVHPDDFSTVMQGVREYLDHKTPRYTVEYRLRCKDGSYKWTLARGQAVWDEAGTPIRMVGSQTDISDRKRAEAALQQTLNELEVRVEKRTAQLKQVNEQLHAKIEQHQQAEEALRQSEEQFRRVFNDSPIGMSLENLDYYFMRVNQALCEMLGYEESELMTLKCWELVHPEDWERELLYQEQLLKGEIDSYQLEERLFKKNQEIIWVNLTVVLLRNEFGETPYILGMAEDITERKQAEAEFRKALEKERELSEFRFGFVSLVSHEFRTPLTTIQSSAELLGRYKYRLSDEQKQNHLTRILGAVSRMTQLLEDVLTIGKAEAGKLNVEPAPIDLVALCGDIVENLQFSASPKHSINFSVQGDCSAAQMDEKLLGHIVTNLLSNALKYSPEGGTVQFDLIGNPESVVFRIQDRGIGIPPEYLDQMFETFQRARNVGSIPGTGLGLAIVKRCVDLHGGQIAVDSEVGAGTTFTVTLPLHLRS